MKVRNCVKQPDTRENMANNSDKVTHFNLPRESTATDKENQNEERDTQNGGSHNDGKLITRF